MISPLTTFPRLSAPEESNLILQDVFEYDSEGMNIVLGNLCEENGIAFDWDLNGNEIDNLIIDNEDLIAHMYQEYQNQSEAPEIVEEAVESVDSSEFIDF